MIYDIWRINLQKQTVFRIASTRRRAQLGTNGIISMKRHPDISLRQPEATSIARARVSSKKKVDELFDVLTKIIDQSNINASRICNMDETGLSTVQKPQKILARKGKHQVGAITSGERGTNTTCVCCMSASGNYVPPSANI
jgi:hypothetical protein